jgi:hypothetical protein
VWSRHSRVFRHLWKTEDHRSEGSELLAENKGKILPESQEQTRQKLLPGFLSWVHGFPIDIHDVTIGSLVAAPPRRLSAV